MKAQKGLLVTLRDLGDAAGMAAVIEQLLRADPDNAQVYNGVQAVYHEVLFDFPAAYRFNEHWLEGHPQDPGARCNLAESLLTIGRLAGARDALAGLIADRGADPGVTDDTEPLAPGTVAALRLLHLAALIGLGDTTAAAEARTELIAFLTAQPEDLQIGWSFDGTRHYIDTAPAFAPHRDTLLPLLDAAGEGRDALLALLAGDRSPVIGAQRPAPEQDGADSR